MVVAGGCAGHIGPAAASQHWKKKWPVSTVLLIFLCVLNRDLKDNSIGDLKNKKGFKFGALISFFKEKKKTERISLFSDNS